MGSQFGRKKIIIIILRPRVEDQLGKLGLGDKASGLRG